MSLDHLIRATETIGDEQTLGIRLDPAHWRTLAGYMGPQELRPGEVLVAQDEPERALFLVEQGTLQVHALPVGRRVELLRAGSAIGEGSLFVDRRAQATVETLTPAIVWSLSAARVTQLAKRSPDIAYEVLRAAGALLVQRQLRR